MTRTGDWEIRSVSGRLPDNPGELACMLTTNSNYTSFHITGNPGSLCMPHR